MAPVRNGVRVARKGTGFVAQVLSDSLVVAEFERTHLWDAMQDAEQHIVIHYPRMRRGDD